MTSNPVKVNKGVFLDKDGTLIKDVPYNVSPCLINLHACAVEGLRMICAHGFIPVIVSNQSGIAKGYFKEDDLKMSFDKINALLEVKGVKIDHFYYCPHHPEGRVVKYAIDCDCRKPKPGMILRAAEDLNIDLSASWMFGDNLHDVEAGKKAGCRTILLNNGKRMKRDFRVEWRPDFIVTNLIEAMNIICQRKRKDLCLATL